MFDGDLKTIMFLAMVAALFLLAYGISSRGPRAERPVLPTEPEPGPSPQREAQEPGSFYEPHINPDLVVTPYNFRNFDAEMGPPDPEDFYDELVFNAYNRSDGYRFTGSMMVATPRGLAAEIKHSCHAYLQGDGTVLVNRYDLSTILRALVERHTDPAELHYRLNDGADGRMKGRV
jgi:hypothetical protein